METTIENTFHKSIKIWFMITFKDTQKPSKKMQMVTLLAELVGEWKNY